MGKVPFVHSNFARITDDNYHTIDNRCVYGFLEHFTPFGLCIDVCSPSGSGIVETLKECGYEASGVSDAFSDVDASWIITNPPFTRGLVDEIIYRQVDRVDKREVNGFACLLRSNFSFAKGRIPMFSRNKHYLCKIELLFRPWWSQEKKAQPIHNYAWYIWKFKSEYKLPFVLSSLGVRPHTRAQMLGGLG